jgi:flagellin-like protein
MKSFKKNVKAVSPVLSVLMMIAVAVAASLVTYAWVMGYLGFTTAKVGKAIQIQSIAKSYNSTSLKDDLVIYVQNVGQGSVKLIDIYVDGIKESPAIQYPVNPTSLGEGETATCRIYGYFSRAGVDNLVKIRAVTEDGTFTEGTVTLP